MTFILQFFINLVYFCCFLCVGQIYFEFKRRQWKYQKILMIMIVFISTILWEFLESGGKGLVHAISIVSVLLLYFKENWKNIIAFYFGNMVVLSILSMLLEVISSGIMGYLKINMVENQMVLLDYMILFIFIWIVGKYFTKKYPGEIKNIGLWYWLFFITILFFDSLIVVVLGDFIINTLEASRKYLAIISYWCVVIGLLIQLVLLINTLVTRNVHKENEKLAKQFLEKQNEHYQYLEKREYETKKFRHDIKNHLILLENFMSTKKFEEAQEYLSTINEKVSSFSNQISVNNGIADAILNRFYTEAKEKGITLKVSGHFPMECYITAYDICTILSNLLSNAILAETETEGNEVLMNIKYTDNKVLLTVENDYANELNEVDGVFKTTKQDSLGHGYGLSNVKECVEKNGGYLSISTENHRFKVMIMMLNENEEMV